MSTQTSPPTPTARTSAGGDLWNQVLDPANRADPYPLYTRLREHPVSHQDGDIWVVSGHAEVSQLLKDPRISADDRKSLKGAGSLGGAAGSGRPGVNLPFILTDPPDHERLRGALAGQFTAHRVNRMTAGIQRIVGELLDAREDATRIDVVADLAYPLPVAVICELLGVPRQDQPTFEGWSTALARALDPPEDMTPAERAEAGQSAVDIGVYLSELLQARRVEPRDDLCSALAGDPDIAARVTAGELTAMTQLLLVAGHETTVNLVANGTLAMLRDPELLRRVRDEPGLEVTFADEILRYDPPVHFRMRTTLTDVPIGGEVIPRGAAVVLLLAAGSRDPARFPDPERLVPDRTDNAHLGFGGGLHYCVGAPLARIEGHVALKEVARRLVDPRLVQDPPPYRPAAALRGPETILVDVDGVR